MPCVLPFEDVAELRQGVGNMSAVLLPSRYPTPNGMSHGVGQLVAVVALHVVVRHARAVGVPVQRSERRAAFKVDAREPSGELRAENRFPAISFV